MTKEELEKEVARLKLLIRAQERELAAKNIYERLDELEDRISVLERDFHKISPIRG